MFSELHHRELVFVRRALGLLFEFARQRAEREPEADEMIWKAVFLGDYLPMWTDLLVNSPVGKRVGGCSRQESRPVHNVK